MNQTWLEKAKYRQNAQFSKVTAALHVKRAASDVSEKMILWKKPLHLLLFRRPFMVFLMQRLADAVWMP